MIYQYLGYQTVLVIRVFLKISSKNLQNLQNLENIFVQRSIRTCYLLGQKPACYHSASKAQVTERILN